MENKKGIDLCDVIFNKTLEACLKSNVEMIDLKNASATSFIRICMLIADYLECDRKEYVLNTLEELTNMAKELDEEEYN